MKNFIYNKKGVVYVNVIFILLIVSVLSISLLNILASNNIAINSNNDNYRAGYIIESILELKINEIMELCDQTICNYQADLQTYNYNIEYIKNVNNDILCSPPDFHDYIKNLVPDIEGLSKLANNPFEEYKEKHCYEVDIKCDLDKNCINIISRGEYNRARKFINVELELPIIVDNGTDENGLPKVIISPARVVKYYQTFGL